MIEKRQARHVETSKVEASHESDITLLGNRAALQAIALPLVAAHCGVSVADREIRSLGRLALQPPNGHVADGVAPSDVGQSFGVRHSPASLGLLGGCQLVFPPQALAPGLGTKRPWRRSNSLRSSTRSVYFIKRLMPGADTCRSVAAHAMVPVIMIARITSIWRSVMLRRPDSAILVP